MSEVVRYEATVVTGLEWISAEECREKLCPLNVNQSHGRVFFETDKRVEQIFELKSVDNIFVVIYYNINEQLPQNIEELTLKLQNISSVCEWNKGLNAWIQAFNYKKCDLKTMLDKSITSKEIKPSFRVTCNRTGDQHFFTSQECAALFGSIINETFQWTVSLKDYDIEVVLNIKDKNFYVCLSLTRESLHHRNLISFGPTSLRATIAYNMLRLADIKSGDIVCDPMCGSGALPIECQANWKQTFNIAGDNHPMAIERTQTNCLKDNSRIDIFQLDIKSLPFRNDSIDVFITDLPFGKRLGSKHDNKTLYPALLKEMTRCIKASTGRMILLTQDKKNMNFALGNHNIKKYWKLFRTLFVKIGGLNASIYCLRRKSLPFE
jgi:23S rRNA G2445 N2-methylase RlmL